MASRRGCRPARRNRTRPTGAEFGDVTCAFLPLHRRRLSSLGMLTPVEFEARRTATMA